MALAHLLSLEDECISFLIKLFLKDIFGLKKLSIFNIKIGNIFGMKKFKKKLSLESETLLFLSHSLHICFIPIS